MIKISNKQRLHDQRLAYLHRKGLSKFHKRKIKRRINTTIRGSLNSWFHDKIANGLNATINKNRLFIRLPKKMNFSENYESTILYLTAIRKITERKRKISSSYKLAAVEFDDLDSISTSATLVLTAEISKWDDNIRAKLSIDINRWKPHIILQFFDLGYFDLFKRSPFRRGDGVDSINSTLKLVSYIKGKCGDNAKTRILKRGITDIVGETIKKWTFLHSGLTEAITNVSHHAYPSELNYKIKDKTWYLGGSFESEHKTLKIVFFDQGIGIPKSLPTSNIWEKMLEIFEKMPIVDKRKDAELLKAAVEINRTRTGDNDRGKGLRDLLEFVKQRENGYLSIMSSKALYKYEMINGTESTKTESFKSSLQGTLIIWSVSLKS